jgi:PST family polysaccharide transporter
VTGSTVGALRWNGASLFGKQIVQMVTALVVARIIGPEAYGIIGVATVFVTVATLLMDQGLSAALIQRPSLTSRESGAAASANIGLAAILGTLIVLLAPGSSDFFGMPALGMVLAVLGVALLIKAPAIVPRALLSRELSFRPIAVADLGSSFIGGVIAIVAALLGASYWAIVAQFILVDILTMIWLLIAANPPLPNLDFKALRPLLGFSLRVLASSLLTSVSRNADNVLVGRFMGASAVGAYSLAYRVLMVPVQMLGMMTSRVLFPSFARSAGRTDLIRNNIKRVTRVLAVVSCALMGFVGIAARDGVLLVMGGAWLAAVPVIQIFAVTGARQAIYSVTAPLMTGLGRADWHLRFSIVATILQLVGIIAGLPFGIVGVAVGYTIAGFLMTPVMFWIQHRLVGESLRAHLGAIFPPVGATALAMLAYWSISLLNWPVFFGFLAGAAAYGVVFIAVVWFAMPTYRRHLLVDARSLLAR